MSQSRKRRLAFVLAGGALVMLAAAGAAVVIVSRPFQEWCCAQEWRRFQQPGGGHAIIVYRIPQRLAMPGQGSDAPGFVHLVNSRNEVKQSTRVEMVQDVSEPEWRPGRVTIKLIADWPLEE